MNPSAPGQHRGTTGGPLDVTDKDVLQPVSERQLKDGEQAELAPDELARLDATAEMSREKNDAYLVRSDLEDADQRGPSPGLKDQDDQA